VTVPDLLHIYNNIIF